MRNLFNLSKRQTHKYTDGWSHEDQWNSVGEYSILNTRVVEYPEQYDTLETRAITVRVDSSATLEQITFALYDSLSGGGCRHEHDCCGCATYTVSKVIHRKQKEWVVIQGGYRNL